jgi:hypothetical protein
MIKLERTDVYGWEAAIRGMRNPMNSWHRSDSEFYGRSTICDDDNCPLSVPEIGEDDFDLMLRLAEGGSTHAKYRRMINVTVDITAPLYWWKEFDTYKVGTGANSCSTMHKIHAKEFTREDFSFEHTDAMCAWHIESILNVLNTSREKFLETKDKEHWWNMIQFLPSSYNQKRTIQMNYEVLMGMYRDRKHHKLDEWHTFCDWIRELPYSEIITGRRLKVLKVEGEY